MPKTSSKKLAILKGILNIYTILGIVLIIAATVLMLTPTAPYLWYLLNQDAITDETDTITGPTNPDPDDPNSFSNVISQAPGNSTSVELPPFDPSLTKTNTLKIPKIGVNGEIHEGANAEAQLENGIWRVNDFGTPEDPITIILAAHRFGYLRWSNDFRTKQSFYNLPKTEVGDEIVIIWNQRKYKYKIYRAEDSTQIKDYDADLILYTCRMFNSPVRIFRYAERTN